MRKVSVFIDSGAQTPVRNGRRADGEMREIDYVVTSGCERGALGARADLAPTGVSRWLHTFRQQRTTDN
ncbi:MAG TPA: hypothetical protein VMU60_05475 [Syntrophobacteria bacterium]|nr:hypothetical protein [Syntrophobacteria bacterium]